MTYLRLSICPTICLKNSQGRVEPFFALQSSNCTSRQLQDSRPRTRTERTRPRWSHWPPTRDQTPGASGPQRDGGAAKSLRSRCAPSQNGELLGLAGHCQQRQGVEDAGHVQTQTPKRASKERNKQVRKQTNKQKRKHRENSVRVRGDIGKTQNFLWELATPSCSLLCCPVQRHLQRCRKLIVWAALNVDVCLALLQAAA